jgi:Barstar (barnase inhibitor)
MSTQFEFTASSGLHTTGEAFVLVVPPGIKSKAELLKVVAIAGQFPEYFGGNWDALSDCLRDFGWVKEKQILIVHSDLPLRANAVDCLLYLETLLEAVNDWTRALDRSKVALDTIGYSDHVLRVFFPDSERGTISALLPS